MSGFYLQGGEVMSVVHIESSHDRKGLIDRDLFVGLCAIESIWSLIIGEWIFLETQVKI